MRARWEWWRAREEGKGSCALLFHTSISLGKKRLIRERGGRGGAIAYERDTIMIARGFPVEVD